MVVIGVCVSFLATPAGEESSDQGKEQAQLMIEESECSPKEKRKRFMEIFKGPALKQRATKADVPPCTVSGHVAYNVF